MISRGCATAVSVGLSVFCVVPATLGADGVIGAAKAVEGNCYVRLSGSSAEPQRLTNGTPLTSAQEVLCDLNGRLSISFANHAERQFGPRWLKLGDVPVSPETPGVPTKQKDLIQQANILQRDIEDHLGKPRLVHSGASDTAVEVDRSTLQDWSRRLSDIKSYEMTEKSSPIRQALERDLSASAPRQVRRR